MRLFEKKDGGIRSLLQDIGYFTLDKSVLLLFVLICTFGLIYADQPASYIIEQTMTRFFRNIVLILSLIVPVWAGMGLNFSIVVGAMAAQTGLIIVINESVFGLGGIFLAFIISVPIAVFLGFLTGKLFNMTKGQEMITGMILGYFANGVFQMIFMYLFGTVFPIKNDELMVSESLGINALIDFDKSMSGAIEKILKVSLDKALLIIIGMAVLYFAIRLFRTVKQDKAAALKSNGLPLALLIVAGICIILLSEMSKSFQSVCMFAKVPVATALIAAIVGTFITFLGNTKLGSDIKTVGQSMAIARASGINVNKVRIISIIISTTIAALGQIIYLQNLGTMTTYSAADQIGTFSVAALLVGGASIRKATIGQAVMGAILFHLMFIVAPIAGKNIFGDAQIGEFFRVFVSYAVIAIALALHAWKTSVEEKRHQYEH